jgi:hypothetical protein
VIGREKTEVFLSLVAYAKSGPVINAHSRRINEIRGDFNSPEAVKRFCIDVVAEQRNGPFRTRSMVQSTR